MTTEDIQKRIDNIQVTADAGDDEYAHSQEDQLREDFIRYVSTLHIPSLAAKAKLVLSTENIKFSRWCA